MAAYALLPEGFELLLSLVECVDRRVASRAPTASAIYEPAHN